MRIHSQCLTGDVFHSLRCDCRAQLEIALRGIAEEGRGLLIYEHQEGRGIGLMNKLRAYELQDQGADTVEANEQLGFDSDLRNYELPGAILRYFGLKAVRLISNNPEKVEAVENAGVAVVERVPCLADVVDTRAYLRTKKERMGHLLEFDDIGGWPKKRLYSRLNWLALSYPTSKAALAASRPSMSMRPRAACNRSCF